MSDTGPRPTKAFYIVITVVALLLVGFALYRAGILAPKGKTGADVPKLSEEEMKKLQQPKAPEGPEAADPNAPTTVKEYSFVNEQKLPPVEGVSGYKKLEDGTVKMALNVWAGWAPIIYAN